MAQRLRVHLARAPPPALAMVFIKGAAVPPGVTWSLAPAGASTTGAQGAGPPPAPADQRCLPPGQRPHPVPTQADPASTADTASTQVSAHAGSHGVPMQARSACPRPRLHAHIHVYAQRLPACGQVPAQLTHWRGSVAIDAKRETPGPGLRPPVSICSARKFFQNNFLVNPRKHPPCHGTQGHKFQTPFWLEVEWSSCSWPEQRTSTLFSGVRRRPRCPLKCLCAYVSHDPGQVNGEVGEDGMD
jgi:hypothetical protein